jgi:hypothetical protein
LRTFRKAGGSSIADDLESVGVGLPDEVGDGAPNLLRAESACLASICSTLPAGLNSRSAQRVNRS